MNFKGDTSFGSMIVAGKEKISYAKGSKLVVSWKEQGNMFYCELFPLVIIMVRVETSLETGKVLKLIYFDLDIKSVELSDWIYLCNHKYVHR